MDEHNQPSATHIILGLIPFLLLFFLLGVAPFKIRYTASLIITIAVTYLIRLIAFEHDPNELHAAVFTGVLDAATPLAVIFNSYVFVELYTLSGALKRITDAMTASLRGDRLLATLVFGLLFSSTIEGIVGFGAAPIVAGASLLATLSSSSSSSSSSTDARRVAFVVLALNSLLSHFGSFGIPLYFGLENITTDYDQLRAISMKTSIVSSVQTLCVSLPLALYTIAAPDHLTRRAALYAILALVLLVAPLIPLSYLSYEFGGAASAALALGIFLFILSKRGKEAPAAATAAAEAAAAAPVDEPTRLRRRRQSTRRRRGGGNNGDNAHRNKHHHEHHHHHHHHASLSLHHFSHALPPPPPSAAAQPPPSLVVALLPVLLALAFVLVTRIVAPLRRLLKYNNSALRLPLGTLADALRVSPALIVSVDGALGVANQTFSVALLYIPSFLPFFVVSVACLRPLHVSLRDFARHCVARAAARMRAPTKALVLTLILSALLSASSSSVESCVALAADAFLAITASSPIAWRCFAFAYGVLAGALTGSVALGNYLFASTQAHVATQLDIDATSLLALHTAGAAVGKAACAASITTLLALLADGDQNSGAQQFVQRRILIACAASVVVAAPVAFVV